VWDSLIVRYLSGALTAMTLTSCTLLLGLSDKQCSTNAECVSAQIGDVCVDRVCQFANGCQGSGCYQNDGGVDRCSSDRDCRGNTPRCLKNSCVTADIFTQWSCPSQGEAETETVQYGFKVVDFLTREPPKGTVVVKACRNGDVACDSPVYTFEDKDGKGDAKLTLPAGFNGFFEVTSDQVPALLYVTKPVIKDTTNRDVPMLTNATVELLATLAGFPYDAEKGLSLLEMIDCTGKPGGGVQFKSSRTAPDQFYIIDQVPSKDATVTKYDPTDNTADGGFLNLDPGFINYSAHLGVDGIQLGSFNAQIRAGTITYIDLNF
jgi:hypothetical protein